MNDQEARERLIDLVYGELDPPEAETLMQKVRRSPELAEELSRLRHARAALALYRAGEPRRAVRVTAARSVSRTVYFRRFLGAAAAVAAAIIIAVGAWRFFEGTTGVAVAGPVEIKRLNVSLTVLSEPEPEEPMQYQQTEGQLLRWYRPGPRRDWPGLALVRDQRLIANLKKGTSEVRFTDVPSGILPDTVRLRSLDRPRGLTILEQNYQYDLASAAAILRKYVDRPITVMYKDGARAAGELLSFDGSTLVVRPAGEGPTNISREMVKDIRLAELPEGLLSTPTLVWLLENQAAARQQFEVAYMTHGLKWRADYVLKLHPAKAAPKPAESRNPQVTDTADLVGYATVTNDS
ncbi:MAG: hypothetical protein AMJ81_08135, partial [Phycisphaerae bacterium SM23_33]